MFQCLEAKNQETRDGFYWNTLQVFKIHFALTYLAHRVAEIP